MMSRLGEPLGRDRKKRGKGRPAASEESVGRESLLVATEQLLRTIPPSRITLARIAEATGADGGLVRYYFGSRNALLMAVIDRVTAHASLKLEAGNEPLAELATHISKTVQLTHSAPFLHRLMIDEMVQAGTDQTRGRVTKMNLDLIRYYRELFQADSGKELRELNPLFLHLVILGASDFFASASSLVSVLLPEDADLDEEAHRYEKFLISLILDGVKKR